MNVSQLLNRGYKMVATEMDTTIAVDPTIRQVQYTYYGPPAPVSEEDIAREAAVWHAQERSIHM